MSDLQHNVHISLNIVDITQGTTQGCPRDFRSRTQEILISVGQHHKRSDRPSASVLCPCGSWHQQDQILKFTLATLLHSAQPKMLVIAPNWSILAATTFPRTSFRPLYVNVAVDRGGWPP
ncbi:hypothetical protein PV05_08288 [Exophiala xenobiotica]|uniref:Uncharacterized protein n=1 Tax=Exophiala xenobiotica TaxID=348802 RepID=A0A0D2CRP4_9EURO|nr:uncharacterized protein PV05_08288 [Exophiala xenobiotica]KIW52662.1 hypothetical protein PV05_08288 [Exophiala xenobiotica]